MSNEICVKAAVPQQDSNQTTSESQLNQSQTVHAPFRDQTADIEDKWIESYRVPDIIKNLDEFSGNCEEFRTWFYYASRLMKLYAPIQGTPKYLAILVTIREKIKGYANLVLKVHITALDWDAISQCLWTEFSYYLFTETQEGATIHDFYFAVHQQMTLILNEIKTIAYSSESMEAMARQLRVSALDRFILGLNGDLPLILTAAKPEDMRHALQLCEKLENKKARNNIGYRNFRPTVGPKPPQNANKNLYPQRMYSPGLPSKQHYNTNFYSPRQTQNAFIPQNKPPQNNNPILFNTPPRAFAPKPQTLPTPIPMGVVGLITTKNANSMNRPNNNNSQLFVLKRVNETTANFPNFSNNEVFLLVKSIGP